MPGVRARVLLMIHEPNLQELNRIVLETAGFEVIGLPPETDPQSFVLRENPDVIVVDVRPSATEDWQTIDRLQADPETRRTPVVAIAMLEPAAAEAQAAPITRRTIVAPYDIAALEDAVDEALRFPPPAAAYPTAPGPVPEPVARAANAMSQHARQIAVRTVRHLLETEPYRSRFSAITRDLIDAFGTMIGAIAEGLRQGAPPDAAFRLPMVRKAIDEHAQLRTQQGLGIAAVVREDQILQYEIGRFLRDRVGQEGFTAMDALDVLQRVQLYLHELLRIILEHVESRDHS